MYSINRREITFFAFAIMCVCLVSCRNTESGRQRRAANNEERNCNSLQKMPIFGKLPPPVTNGPKGDFCGGQCCGTKSEVILREQAQEDFARTLKYNSDVLQGSLSSISNTLQNYITELTLQSENKSQTLAAQVYRTMSLATKEPISQLYTDIKNYFLITDTDGFLPTPIDIKASVASFFESLFPVAYRHAMDSLTADFTVEYKQCLLNSYNELQPFGETPQNVAQSLAKSLDSTRLLFQSLEIGAEVLNSTNALMATNSWKNDGCLDALMKMNYCPKCLGLNEDLKPCSGYCLNVLRGCLSRYVAELDAPWNGYVEGIERLVTSMKQTNNEAGINAGLVIKNLDIKISEAIMHAMAKKSEIENKMKRNCGAARYAESEDPTSIEINTEGNMIKQRNFPQLPDQQINIFLASIAQTKNFYDNLAEVMCKDESYAEPKDRRCWNGERIGEYTKTVVDASLDTQKYNPEVKPNMDLQIVDPKVADLADKLRHVHKMVIVSLGGVNLPEAESYVQQGDDPEQGSGGGSGHGPNIEEDDDDLGGASGSGSSGNTDEPPILTPARGVTTPKPTGASAISYPSTIITLTLILLPTFLIKFTV